jgi:uncharacterized membrane protein
MLVMMAMGGTMMNGQMAGGLDGMLGMHGWGLLWMVLLAVLLVALIVVLMRSISRT